MRFQKWNCNILQVYATYWALKRMPARAIVSVAVFPSEVKDLDSDPKFHKIGFVLNEKDARFLHDGKFAVKYLDYDWSLNEKIAP